MPSGDGPGMTGGLREASAAAREFALGRTQVALGHLVTLPAACTNDTVLALRVGALQAWFGQDKEFADTCRRALDFATGTSDPPTAERTAKISCLRPTQDKTRVASAHALARKAEDLGKNHNWLPRFLSALGMAEDGSGHIAEPDARLMDAATGGKDNHRVAGRSAFYRAMRLLREGKEEDDLQLTKGAASEMKPPPKDETTPLADDAGH